MFNVSSDSSPSQIIYVYIQILVLSVICFFILLSHDMVPDQVDILTPNANENIWLFSDGEANRGGSKARWIDRSEKKFECDINHTVAWPYCGLEIQLTDDYKGVDLSQYKEIKVYVDYDGPSTQIGITLRTYEPSSYIEGDLDSLKNSIVPIDTYELTNSHEPIIIEPKEWQVLHWWLDRYNIAREDRYTDFSHVVMVGFNLSDKPNDGVHNMQLKKIEMVKNSIDENIWYVVVISFWLFFVFILVSWHLIRVLKQSKLHSTKAKELSIYAGELVQISQYHKEEAMRDELTGLNNRKGMVEYLNYMLEKNDSINLSLILFDLDFFKKVNDTYGHDVGDQVLVKVSEIIGKNIRKSDCFCRWGGEEFAILCPSMPIEKSREFANNLCQLISKIDIDTSSGTINVSASFGVSSGEIDKKNLLDEVFEKADNALYKAKNNGRNRVE